MHLQVFRAMDAETGAELAIKQVELHPESGQNNIKVRAEFSLSCSMRHVKSFTVFICNALQEVRALEDEIEVLKQLHHEVCVSICTFVGVVAGVICSCFFWLTTHISTTANCAVLRHGCQRQLHHHLHGVRARGLFASNSFHHSR